MAAADKEEALRSLAPPDVVGSLSSDEDSDSEEEEVDQELERVVAALVKKVEVLRKSHAFPKLEELEAIDQKRETYLGPTMESNWVLPGKLLVGAYPASVNDSHHAHLLCTILLQGVSTFVCLQQEYRADGVTEEMWRSGEVLRPYFQDVLQLLRKLQELKAADPRSVPAICAPQDVDFVHFPIVDCNVADDTKVLQLALRLAARLARGEVMYLHCWGGHGRTGTVVCIMLHLMYDLSADEAMERCQHVHDVRRIPISVGSPQTDAQRQQVRRVIAHLKSRRACSPVKAAPLISGDVSSKLGGASVAAPSSPGGKKLSSAGLESTSPAGSGRRGWVRSRRQALAQAPNGENVARWRHGAELEQESDDCREGHLDYLGKRTGADESCAAPEDNGVGCGRTTRARTSSPAETAEMGPSAAGELTDASATSAGTPTAPRRKSFTEPYSEEDPSRGTRNTRLRRKSAPGKPPADVLAERAAEVALEKEDDESVLSTVLGSTTPVRSRSRSASVRGEDELALSPGSCTGCVTRSTANASAAGLAPCVGGSRRHR